MYWTELKSILSFHSAGKLDSIICIRIFKSSFYLYSVLDFLPAQYASINGIEAKVLQERESLLSYSRCELQQFYIEEVCSSPVYNYAFFACKVKYNCS